MFDNRRIYCPIRLGHAQYKSVPPPLRPDLQAVNVRGMPREGESASALWGPPGKAVDSDRPAKAAHWVVYAQL